MSDLNKNNIQKNWLYTLFVSSGMTMIFYIISLFTNSNLRSLMNHLGRNIFIFLIIFQIIFILGWLYIYYRCAYKKPGRKFLVFNLIFTPLSLTYTILQSLNLFPFLPKATIAFTIYDKIIFILGLALNIVFYIFSLKLFKFNKEIQNRLTANVPKD